jgi:hypothetical protein
LVREQLSLAQRQLAAAVEANETPQRPFVTVRQQPRPSDDLIFDGPHAAQVAQFPEVHLINLGLGPALNLHYEFLQGDVGNDEPRINHPGDVPRLAAGHVWNTSLARTLLVTRNFQLSVRFESMSHTRYETTMRIERGVIVDSRFGLAAHEENPLSPVVANELVTIEATTDKSDSGQKVRRVHPYLKFGVTVLTLLAVVWYAYEANEQRVAMDHTLHEAQHQTTLMQQQVEGTTGAMITKQFRITWPKQAYLSVTLDNRGKAIGSGIHADFHMTEISLPDERAKGNALPNWEFSIPEIGPTTDLPVERGIYLNISQEELQGHPMPRAIKLTGTFTYSNGFHEKDESVCIYVLGGVEFKNKLGKVQQSQGAGMVVTCDGLPDQVAGIRQIQKLTSAQ